MKQTFNSILRKAFFLSAIFFLTLLFSCKKDGELSPNFDNGNLAISYVDTFSVTTSVEKEDSLRTDDLLLNMLGIYNDPIFGPVSSSIYTQALLTGLDLDFNTSTLLVDSAVLTLDYVGFHGNPASQMTVNVFELDTDLDKNIDYYSSNYSAYKPMSIGSLNYAPNMIPDSVDIDFDTIRRKSHLRLKLNNTFGDAILGATPSQLSDDDSFTNFMKGFCITTSETVNNTTLSQSDGSIAYFDMNSELSTLTLYYDDTSSYSFTINTSSEKYSRFDQNYTGTDVEAHLNNDISKKINRTYVSSMAGVKTRIELPTIQDLYKDGPVVINKAEIIFTVEQDSELPNDAIDETVYLVGIDVDGNQIILADNNSAIESDPAHFGGTYDSGNKSYTFNISRHLHQILNSTTPNYGMYLVSSSAKTEANRVVLGSGEKNGAYKTRLEITYSKI
tara:strand:+ start:5001 stop:6338 length:1338 start_codon:yes stop_codon:yes gene_type:complete